VTEPTTAVPRWWGRPVQEVRWQLEAARLLADPVYRGIGVPRGDGRAVLLLPGFLAGDYTMFAMGSWLARIGYRPAYAGFVANVGCSEHSLQQVTARARALGERDGRRIAVVGHSRGGHFARALAARHPELVEHAIVVGGGLVEQQAVSVPTQAAVSAVRAVHRHTTDRRRRRGCLSSTCTCSFASDYLAPLADDVVLTSIYSRGDGVVRWQSCIAPDANCVEVSGSHVGLAFNRKVYRAVAVALAARRKREPERD
jgi:triacylglycerol lipase